ncbi:MAG: LemA family protein [Coprobacillus sp.]
MVAIIIGVVVLLIAIFVFTTFNSLTRLRNKVKAQWAQVDVVLKRRADLIPNLVETVKGYATHEKETLDAVITARNTYTTASSMEDQMKSSGELTQALSKLLMLGEAYPDLKANTNFIQLQNELRDTEDKISFARQFYNDTVYSYQNKIEMFPSNIIAGMFGFKEIAFFETDEADKKVPEVKF